MSGPTQIGGQLPQWLIDLIGGNTTTKDKPPVFHPATKTRAAYYTDPDTGQVTDANGRLLASPGGMSGLDPLTGQPYYLEAPDTGQAPPSPSDMTAFTTGGTGSRLTTDNPLYWQNEADKLTAQYVNMGLDAESARRQALAQVISTRASLANNTAQTSADVAKTAAQFAANPRDTYAEALYRNQVGGSTPFGDTNNSAFGEYGKALANKAASIFQPVAADLNASRAYRDASAPVDFLGANQRQQLNLGPTPAQSLVGDTGGGLPASTAPAPAPNGLQMLHDRLDSFNPQQKADFANYVTGGQAGAKPEQFAKGGKIRVSYGNIGGHGGFDGGGIAGFATGGQIDIGNLTRFGGDQPSSSEGGTNMNIHEPAVLVGLHSGRHYATVAENGYPEQIKITPTPAGKKAAMEAEKAGKAQKDVMGKAFGTGGTIGADPSLDDMNAQYSKLLERLGGQGGGSTTPFGGARFLAGAPANAIQASPFLKGVTDAGYSIRGIDPAELWAQVGQFQPNSPQNNTPRISW